MTFTEMNISEAVCRALREKEYETPTPIQQQAIPEILKGNDILGLAQTGTGKTAAFSIPIIEQLVNTTTTLHAKGRKHEIRALILTPTRELAIQIDESFADYAKYTPLRHTVIFGGVKQKSQTDELRNGTDILTATPGRLLDLISQGFIHLDGIRHFVLDEADRMLDMGFIHDIKRILPKLPRQKQTLFFSATMPDSIDKLSKSLLHNPIRVEVAPVSSVVETISQTLYYVEKSQKKTLLTQLIRQEEGKSVLVFSRTKHGADNIARNLIKQGIPCESIHGNKSQNARQRALKNFKENRTHVIVATDIAARGIDIKELDLVVNYDLPDVAETYVHRIGRTGRAGHQGCAVAFCANDERAMVRDIEKLTARKLKVLQHTIATTLEESDECSQDEKVARTNSTAYRAKINRVGNRTQTISTTKSNSAATAPKSNRSSATPYKKSTSATQTTERQSSKSRTRHTVPRTSSERGRMNSRFDSFE